MIQLRTASTTIDALKKIQTSEVRVDESVGGRSEGDFLTIVNSDILPSHVTPRMCKHRLVILCLGCACDDHADREAPPSNGLQNRLVWIVEYLLQKLHKQMKEKIHFF